MNSIYSIIIIWSTCLLGLVSCQKSEIPVYSGDTLVQLKDTIPQGYTFLYEPSAISRDTLWIPITVIGGKTAYDRAVSLIQVQEYRDSLIYDQSGKQIGKESVPVLFTAIPGKHYIAFDQPTMKELLIVKAGQVEALLPIILLRDPSLKDNSYRLRLSFAENDNFRLGDSKLLEKLVQFSDRYERFYSWRFDNFNAPAFGTFGKYSQRKHEFIYETLGEPITEEWYQALAKEGAQNHYQNIMREALFIFNSTPENISSGKAPMRETDDEKSPLITF